MGTGGWGLKKKREREVGEKEGQTGLSAERLVKLMPCTGAQNYLRLNDPIHSSDAPSLTSNTKPWLTSPKCQSAFPLYAPSRENSNSDRHKWLEWDSKRHREIHFIWRRDCPPHKRQRKCSTISNFILGCWVLWLRVERLKVPLMSCKCDKMQTSHVRSS